MDMPVFECVFFLFGGVGGAHREVSTDDFSYEETVRRVPVLGFAMDGGGEGDARGKALEGSVLVWARGKENRVRQRQRCREQGEGQKENGELQL